MNDDIKELMYPFCVQPDIEKLKSVEIDMGEVYDLHETLYLDYAKKSGEWIPNMYGTNENLEAISFI